MKELGTISVISIGSVLFVHLLVFAGEIGGIKQGWKAAIVESIESPETFKMRQDKYVLDEKLASKDK